MFKSVQYVVKENFSNLYRIFCIAKYELLADMRDSKFGLFWNFASPAIQVLTYFLIFGLHGQENLSNMTVLKLIICLGWSLGMLHGGLFSHVSRMVVMPFSPKPALSPK